MRRAVLDYSSTTPLVFPQQYFVLIFCWPDCVSNSGLYMYWSRPSVSVYLYVVQLLKHESHFLQIMCKMLKYFIYIFALMTAFTKSKFSFDIFITIGFKLCLHVSINVILTKCCCYLWLLRLLTSCFFLSLFLEFNYALYNKLYSFSILIHLSAETSTCTYRKYGPI